MKQHIALISILVEDYDAAILWYTKKLHFKLLEDTKLTKTKRWVRISPPGSNSTALLLAKAANKKQKEFIGNQSGGRVFLFLYTDDFWRDYNNMRANSINFIRPPKEESYGIVAVFEDLYGNLWDFIEPGNQEV